LIRSDTSFPPCLAWQAFKEDPEVAQKIDTEKGYLFAKDRSDKAN
jgi:hypothetical protein